jgi:hypothetical protein
MTIPDNQWFEAFDAKDFVLLRSTLREALVAKDYDCLLHPLGFFFSRLVVRGPSSIRLHYWPPNIGMTGTAITPFHDHVWKLRSCIMVGKLHNVLIDVDEDEGGPFHIAQINQAAGIDEVRPEEKTFSTRVKSRETYHAGDIYDIEPRVFHYTDIPADQATVTLVRADVMVEGGPRTLVPLGFKGHAPSREPLASSPAILCEIEKLL